MLERCQVSLEVLGHRERVAIDSEACWSAGSVAPLALRRLLLPSCSHDLVRTEELHHLILADLVGCILLLAVVSAIIEGSCGGCSCHFCCSIYDSVGYNASLRVRPDIGLVE